MNKGWIVKIILILFCSFMLIHCATDGSRNELCKSIPNYDIEKHKSNADKAVSSLLSYLDKNGERSAIVARAGGDLSTEEFRNPVEQKYTHTGFVWKSSQDGEWRFKHLLNICEGSSSGIFTQTLFQFFDDDPYFYDVRVGMPSSGLQKKIADVLESDLADTLHNPLYSKISNPFSTSYQNSNAWVLAVIASAQSGLKTLEEVQKYYKDQGFSPSQVHIGFWRGLFSSFIPNVTLMDHTYEEKVAQWYNFVSTASLFQYLQDTDSSVSAEICHENGCNIFVSELNQ